MDHRTRIKNFFTFQPIDRIPFIDWGGHPCFYMDRWKKKWSIPADADPFVLAGYDGSEGPGTDEIVPGPSEYRGHLYAPTKGLEHVYFNIYALPEFEAREWTDEEGYLYRTSPLMGGVAKIKPATKENPLGGLTTLPPHSTESEPGPLNPQRRLFQKRLEIRTDNLPLNGANGNKSREIASV